MPQKKYNSQVEIHDKDDGDDDEDGGNKGLVEKEYYNERAQSQLGMGSDVVVQKQKPLQQKYHSTLVIGREDITRNESALKMLRTSQDQAPVLV